MLDGGVRGRAVFQVGPVSKTVLSFGKLVSSGRFAVEFGPSGAVLRETGSGKCLPIERHHNTFYLKVRSATCAAIAGPTEEPPRVDDMPADAGGAASSSGPPRVDERGGGGDVAPPLGAARPADDLVDAAPTPLPGDLRPHSRVEEMRARLRQLSAPIWGTKAILYARLVEYEAKAEAEKALREKRAADIDERIGERAPAMARPLALPPAPSDQERREHEITHFPARVWCQFCVLGKATQQAHRPVLPHEREHGGAEVQMDYAFFAPTGERAESGAPAWATVLALVHVGTGFGHAAAVQRKGADAVDNRQKYVAELGKTLCD